MVDRGRSISPSSPLRSNSPRKYEEASRGSSPYNPMRGMPEPMPIGAPIPLPPPVGGRFDRVEQAELAQHFKDIVFIEREVEASKIELALKSDFNVLDCFRMFDIHGRGFITQHDLSEGLRSSLLFNDFSNDDVYLFFRRNDLSGRGSLNLQSFSAGILPFSPEYAQLVTDRPDYYIARGCTDF
jgi:hypothetical protein